MDQEMEAAPEDDEGVVGAGGGNDLLLAENLVTAATVGSVARVVAFLDQGADIDARGANGMNALHWASENGHRGVVALLLDRGGRHRSCEY